MKALYDSASSAVYEKLASNDNFEIVVREIENFETHVFKISVSICLSKHRAVSDILRTFFSSDYG